VNIIPAKATTVATSAPPPFQLDPQVRNDSISALRTLGFPKHQAQVRVAGVKSGSSTEEIIKAALQQGVR
jgi:Holliday junction resolvasome RuvABC DNA-binding subunit